MPPGKIARSRRSTITTSNRSISFDDKGLKGTFRLRDFPDGPPQNGLRSRIVRARRSGIAGSMAGERRSARHGLIDLEFCFEMVFHLE